MSVALWIIAILSAITVLERLKVVSARLGTPLFSVQTFRDMFERNHDFDRMSSGTMTSRLNEPSTSLSKLTKNVNDYLDKPGDKKSEPSSKPSTTSSNTASTSTPPPPPSKAETQPTQNKAQYLDKTDPNETGRNVAQIVFGEEEEENERYKKFLASSQNQNTVTQDTKQDTKQDTNASSSKTDSSKKPSDQASSSDIETKDKQ